MMQFRLGAGRIDRVARFLFEGLVLPRIERGLGRTRKEDLVLDHVLATTPAGDPGAALRAMDEFAMTKRWLMNVGPAKGQVLERALERVRARRVLEIGAYCGYSATLIASVLVRDGARDDAHLLSIEKGRHCAAIAGRVVEHAGLGDVVSVVHGTLASTIDTLHEPFDAVFLDHWKDEYLPDLRRLEQAGLLHEGTVVVADNIGFFRSDDYLRYVRSSPTYSSEFVESSVEYNEHLRDGVEVSVYLGPAH